MIDADEAQRAREWLERQLAELGQLRNATRRDQNFKNWRQQTLTVIQRIWPGDTRRSERFRRIPFTPPSTHTDERQVREYYERGWGEAGILLRELLAEINLLGLPRAQPRPYGHADEAGPPDHAPVLDLPATRARAPAEDNADIGRADIGRAMERLLGRTPLFRMPSLRSPAPAASATAPAPPPAAPVPQAVRPVAPEPGPHAAVARSLPPGAALAHAEPATAPAPALPPRATPAPQAVRLVVPEPAPHAAAPHAAAPAPPHAGPAPLATQPMSPEPDFLVSELGQLVEELDGLDLTRERALPVRRALLALALAVESGPPPWALVSEALAQAGASPALARRALPLLLELVARAA